MSKNVDFWVDWKESHVSQRGSFCHASYKKS